MRYDAAIIGSRIRGRRKELGLTQTRLAEMMDLSPTYLGQIENGHRGVNLQNLIELASVLGVTLDYLVSDFTSEQLLRQDAVKDRWLSLLDGCSPEEAARLIKAVEALLPVLFPR